MSGMERTIQATLIVTVGERAQNLCEAAGFKHVANIGRPEYLLDKDGSIKSEYALFERYVIVIPKGGEMWRDRVAMTLGDERCLCAYVPDEPADLANAVATARPMWTDEVATIDDVPEPRAENAYKSGFDAIDEHGFRLVLPAFMPVIGPYGSGKSVFLRQLLVNLWKLHGWKFLLTSFEERVKPRYQRDLRRHMIGRPEVSRDGEYLWTDELIAKADAEIRQSAVFLRRKRGATLDMERLLDRLEFAVRVHGVKVVAIDPVNEIDHQVGKGESKTDYMGRFIMAMKALADDYDLLMIVCAHPPKDGVEKRLSRTGLLTLNDGADTAHWGNKADIGFCLWRNLDGPTYLHADKLKDHETMGKPFLAELLLDEATGKFRVGDMGYHILRKNEAE